MTTTDAPSKELLHFPNFRRVWIRGSLILATMVAATVSTGANAGVFYRLQVVAESGTGDFIGFGPGPSINKKGKVAFISKLALGDSIGVWSPVGGVSDIASSFVSSNRSFGDSAQINDHDEVAAWNRRTGATPIGEVRIFRSATPNDSTVMVRGIPDFFPGGYDVLFQFPVINNTRNLEDRSQGGNLDGVCNGGESCVPQTAFGAFRADPLTRTLNTVNKNPQAGTDFGQFNERGINTIVSRPMMADDGRIVVRGNLPTNPVQLYDYDLSRVVQIGGAAEGFTALGAAPGITPDGKIVAFAGNRGNGDGVFLSFEGESGVRRLIRIAGENNVVPKPELGYDAARGKLFFKSIALDSRVAIVYTPDASGARDKSIVVSFMGTPNAASRVNPGNGKPFSFTDQLGLWTMRIDLNAALYVDDETEELVCVTRVSGSGAIPDPVGDDLRITPSHPKSGGPYIAAGPNGRCDTPNDDRTETLFSRTSPIPVVQIGDTIQQGAKSHVISALSTNFPLAQASFDTALSARTPRTGDHRVAFWAQAGSIQLIVKGDHLDSDQDGLLDHWEVEGLSLDGSGVDLDLPGMGADPFKRDLFVQMDWTLDRGGPLNYRHDPAPGVIQRLAQFYASAPALPNGIPAGIQLHVDAGSGLDAVGRVYSRNMHLGALRGGQTVVSPTGGPIDLLYMEKPGSVNFPGLVAVAFDTVKANYFWKYNRGAREYAFMHIVFADAHHGLPDNVNPIRGTVTRMTSDIDFVDVSNDALRINRGGHGVVITAGKGKGQFRRINLSGKIPSTDEPALQVSEPWSPLLDSTSQYMLLDGSSGLGGATTGYDGNFGPGKNLAITLASFPPMSVPTTSGMLSYLGTFSQQWKTLAHEMGHLVTLKHGGENHTNFKADFLSLMNYAYQLCPQGEEATDADGDPLLGAATCPIDDYSNQGDDVFPDWSNVNLKSSLNFAAVGNAFGRDPEIQPPLPPEERETMTYQQILTQFGPQDSTGPSVVVTVPASGANITKGTAIAVTFSALDLSTVARAEVVFDVNGDGSINETSEIFPAVRGSGNLWTASIPTSSGANGSRSISAHAYDRSGNSGLGRVVVSIGSTPVPVVGDVNGDGKVTCADAAAVRSSFGKRASQSGFNAAADVVKDGVINIRDLSFVTLRLPKGTKCP